MNTHLTGKKILIGITGGIAAYKICELIRLLRGVGAQVQVVTTHHAKEFVAPLTLEVLSGKPVYADLFDHQFESNIGHIQLSRWADVIMVAPASADFMARLSHGLADDLLTTLCLATQAPIVVAPAMNRYMWHNKATQENVDCLKKRGIYLIEPDEGEQACGDNGVGRLVLPTELLAWLETFFSSVSDPVFSGKKVLITAGPTHEAIDPVRYISTQSSGMMGYAIADAIAKCGAQVILVSGPSSLVGPNHVKKIDVRSANDMHQAVTENLPCDIFVGAAAVSDYRPEFTSSSKIKRDVDLVSLKLVKNPDILCSVKNAYPSAFIVSFAAETDNHFSNAKEKLKKKGANMMVLNAVENGKGFGLNKSSVTFLTPDGRRVDLPELNKNEIALRLTAFIRDFFLSNTP